MSEKIGRNDPCPCGSGKKYKQCCLKAPTGNKKRKFAAKVLTQTKQPLDLLERTYGSSIAKTKEGQPEAPPAEQESLGLEPPRM